MYIAKGSEQWKTAEHVIILCHDICGPRAGYTQARADELAASCGAAVVMPDFFHGTTLLVAPDDSWLAWLRLYVGFPAALYTCRTRFHWRAIGADFDATLNALRSDATVGALGFCFGGWVVLRASSNARLACAAAGHSALELTRVHGESLEALLNDVACPQMFLQCKNDPSLAKAGGLAQRVLDTKSFGADCVYHEYKNEKHGFITRGGASATQEPAKSDIDDAMHRFAAFFKKHLNL